MAGKICEYQITRITRIDKRDPKKGFQLRIQFPFTFLERSVATLELRPENPCSKRVVHTKRYRGKRMIRLQAFNPNLFVFRILDYEILEIYINR